MKDPAAISQKVFYSQSQSLDFIFSMSCFSSFMNLAWLPWIWICPLKYAWAGFNCPMNNLTKSSESTVMVLSTSPPWKEPLLTLPIDNKDIALIRIHQKFSLAHDWFKRATWLNIYRLQLGNIRVIFSNFENCSCYEKDFKHNKHNSLHLAWKYARIFVLRHYVFLEAHSFPWAYCSLLRTDNARRHVSEHIFAPGVCWFIRGHKMVKELRALQPIGLIYLPKARALVTRVLDNRVTSRVWACAIFKVCTH